MTIKYKSKFEQKIHQIIGSKFQYETKRIKYVIPESLHNYTPDFHYKDVYLETKGKFDLKDRQKHLLLKAQHPELNIIFVFQSPYQKIRKGSPTSYVDWCVDNGFDWISVDKLPQFIKAIDS